MTRTAPCPVLAAALAYTRRGRLVVPLHTPEGDGCSCGKADCGSVGKHPRTEHGLKDASRDESVVRGWWRRWPDANLGVVTVPQSGVWMVGPDGRAGMEVLGDLELEHLDAGHIPRTPRAKSGGGGTHYLFAWPTEGTIKNRKNHLGLPVDVRGAGGYFVAPPSLHKTGNRYQWDIHPDDAPLAPAPPWLLEWARTDEKPRDTRGHVLRMRAAGAPDAVSRAVAYLTSPKTPPSVSGQGGHAGHAALLWAARVAVLGFDLGVETGYQLLRDHFNPRCVPEWSDKELRHKAEEADRVPFSKERSWLLNGAGRAGPNGRPAAPEAGQPAAPRQDAYGIILRFFGEHYQPVFRVADSVYSEARGGRVSPTQTCRAPGIALIELLAHATDAPRDKRGHVEPRALIKLFADWSRVAWQDLVASLPDEAEAAEVSAKAGDDFAAKVAQALHAHVALGVTRVETAGLLMTRDERRPLIDWCLDKQFCTPGRWTDVRGYCIWSRKETDGSTRVAISPGLFAQVGPRELKDMKPKDLAGLCERYGIGRPWRIANARGAELAPPFLADHMRLPAELPLRPNDSDADPMTADDSETVIPQPVVPKGGFVVKKALMTE